MSNDNDSIGKGSRRLPEPNAEWVPSGTPLSAMTEDRVKGILVNPLNAGAGQFPPMVSDAEWVAACVKVLQQDGPEQFLVNLLFVLRQSLDALGG